MALDLDRDHKLHLALMRCGVNDLGNKMARTTRIVAQVKIENLVAIDWEE